MPSLHLIKEYVPFIIFFRVNGKNSFQSPFVTSAGFLLRLFCSLQDLVLSLWFSLGIWPCSSLYAEWREGGVCPAGFSGSYLAFSVSILPASNLFSHLAFYLVPEDSTVHLPGEETVTSSRSVLHSPRSCWSYARLLMGALLMEKKGRSLCPVVIQLLMPFSAELISLPPACPMPGEVVLATFNIVFSSKITPTAPAPSPWILRSTHPIEICFPKLFFFLWLVSLL